MVKPNTFEARVRKLDNDIATLVWAGFDNRGAQSAYRARSNAELSMLWEAISAKQSVFIEVDRNGAPINVYAQP